MGQGYPTGLRSVLSSAYSCSFRERMCHNEGIPVSVGRGGHAGGMSRLSNQVVSNDTLRRVISSFLE